MRIKIFLGLFFLSSPVLGLAQSQATVEELQERLPLYVNNLGYLDAIVVPDSPLVLNINLKEDANPEFMESARANSQEIKYNMVKFVCSYSDDVTSLAHIAYNAGLSLKLHWYADCDPEGFSVTLSPQDLKASFTNDIEYINTYLYDTYVKPKD